MRSHAGRDAGLDAADAGRAEDEDIAGCRPDKIVGDLVDEELVAAVGVAPDDGLPGGQGAAGVNLEVGSDHIERRRHAVGAGARDDFGRGEKVEPGDLAQADDRVIRIGGNVDPSASAQDEVRGAHRPGRKGIDGRCSRHAVKRGLHGAGGNFERLQKISAHAQCDNQGNEDDLGVFPQSGEGWAGCSLVEKSVQFLGCGCDVFARIFAHRHLEPCDGFAQADELLVGKDITAVTQELAGSPKNEFGLFTVSRGEEEHGTRESVAAYGEKAMQRWSDQFFAVIQPCFVNPGCRCSDIGDGVVDGVQGGGDRRVVGPWQIGQSDLRPLEGQPGLLEGFVGCAETFGPRVKGVHCAFGFSSCWHLH